MFRSLFRDIVGSWFGNNKCKKLLLFVIGSGVYGIRLFILKKKMDGYAAFALSRQSHTAKKLLNKCTEYIFRCTETAEICTS